MTGDTPRPGDPSQADSARRTEPTGTAGDRPVASRPVPPPGSKGAPGHGLFHKRPDGIGPAPIYFSVALGITFGASLGLLLDQIIIGIIFGGLLGALYGMIRRANYRG